MRGARAAGVGRAGLPPATLRADWACALSHPAGSGWANKMAAGVFIARGRQCEPGAAAQRCLVPG